MPIEKLNRIIPGFIRAGNLVVIKGYPGSGKTTLAATMCDYVARSRGPCIYVSFQEEKEKFLMNMASLGLRLEELEYSGRFRYVKLPITLDPEAFMQFIQDQIANFVEPGAILVIDPINPIIKAVPSDAAKRAILQNFFASLPTHFKATVVLVEEASASESFGVGHLDYVTDVMLFLRHESVRGLLTRYLEIRKARGSPTLITEVPFSIRSLAGIELYPPVILSEIPPISDERIWFDCSVLRDRVGGINKGLSVYVTYPPDVRPREIPHLYFCLTVLNNARALIISYRYPPNYIRKEFTGWLARDYGISRELVRELFDRHFIVESINPVSVSQVELMAREIDIVEATQPDIVIFHGTDVFPLLGIADENYAANLYNVLQLLSSKGVVAIRDSVYVNESWHTLGSTLAHAVLKFEIDQNGDLQLRIWRGGTKPVTLNEKQIHECLKEMVNKISQKLGATEK